MPLIFVDTEGANPTPTGWSLREFGAVEFKAFRDWLENLGPDRKIFISDNPAYDWPPIHFFFHLYFGENTFGHSARRIGDFYAGLVGDFRRSTEWKKLRITPHDHSPVHDALGNVEALARILAGERVN